MRLDGWNGIQSVQSACSMLYLELTTSILSSREENDERHEMKPNNNFESV